jgi:serine/threonine protein kinase
VELGESLPRLIGGRYRLEAALGHGGMGVVYRATDLTMKRAVAIKLIGGEADGLDDEVAGRFLREAKNTARLQHEHIIEVYDVGRSDDDLYFVMELLEGESIAARLRDQGRFTPGATVAIGRQICGALQVAHAAGIVHRDLKPANVMLIRRAGVEDFVKVLDFGVAKSYSADQETALTHTGMLVGTVEYMAPEQIMGGVVDGRTDLYSLGVVLYKMLAGKAPFRDGGVPSLIHAHLNVMPPPICEQVADVPGSLDRVVLRCLAKRPEQRFESMDELGRALAGALEPESLGLPSLAYGSSRPPGAYPASEQTAVARAPVVADADADGDEFDDATVKMDRLPPLPIPPGHGSGARSSGPQRVETFADETQLVRDDIATAKRLPPDEITRIDRELPRECAMCHTINPARARACSACGVSLASPEQAALRERVTAPRTAQMSAPQMPPPTSGAFPAGGAQQVPYGMSPPQGVPWAGGMAPPPGRVERPVSVWERFLAWTGLKSR